MNNLKFRINNHKEDLIEFVQSTDFATAVIIAMSVTLPIVAGVQLGNTEAGISVSIGALLASPADASGHIYVKLKGIFFATILSVIMTIIGSVLTQSLWVLFPMLGFFMFTISYLSIFGFRATLIGFSGLLALTISFSGTSTEQFSVLEHAALIGVGGLWYIFLSYLRHLIFPKGPAEHFMLQAFRLTAEYIETRGELIDPNVDKDELSKRLLHLQTQLTETHETLRGLLIRGRRSIGKSTDANKKLLVFIQLVDILELGMGTPVNYKKTDVFFTQHPEQLEDFQMLLRAMSQRLLELSSNRFKSNSLTPTLEIDFYLEKLSKDIDALLEQSGGRDEQVLMMRNYIKYQYIQAEKIRQIEGFIYGSGTKELTKSTRENMHRFLTNPNYNLGLLADNFNFQSPVFRHSLRLAITAMMGYAVGVIFEVQNSYWILLTILVIMRPTYGLTKERAIHRTIGTLIGGAVAFGVILVTDNKTIYGALSILSIVIAFSMIQKNYKAAATFVTLNVVFVYALIVPNIFDVIQFRVLDTLIGVGLATFGNLFLWPAWEYQTIDKTLSTTLSANCDYLKEVADWYNVKGEIPSKLKLARKKAFIAMSELNASFQRMAQEPASQQTHLNETYQLVLNSHLFLTASSSLSSYIANHPTTPASEHFNQGIDCIRKNLSYASALLRGEKIPQPCSYESSEELMESTFGSNLKGEKQIELDEAFLVVEQLKWLFDLSLKTVKMIPTIQQSNNDNH